MQAGKSGLVKSLRKLLCKFDGHLVNAHDTMLYLSSFKNVFLFLLI